MVVVRLNGCRVIGSFTGGANDLARLKDEITDFPWDSITFSAVLVRTSGIRRAGNRIGDIGGPAIDCDFEGLRTSLFATGSISKPRGRKRLPQS